MIIYEVENNIMRVYSDEGNYILQNETGVKMKEDIVTLPVSYSEVYDE